MTSWRGKQWHTWYVSVNDLSGWLARSSEKERWYLKARVDLNSEEGTVTKWLRTAEIKAALADNRILKCHEAVVSAMDVEHEQLWRKLRNRILRLYGRRCMRCARTDGQLHLDHIRSWKKYPERRYDPENVQLLCRDCHTWKHCQATELDFRPRA